MAPTPRYVTASDGVRLAVYETGRPSGPTLVALHGYPDNHTVWDGVAALLADHFRVVTYDLRGAGASDKPRARKAYRMAQLTNDLLAVLDAVSPDAPVHLLGHDWGSIQAWSAITDDRLADRIASFTSISGPSLDYAGAWLRQVRRHPRAALRQLAHSYYILFFQLPGLPEAAVRSGVLDRGVQRAGGGRPGTGVRSAADKINGIQLYRANMLPRTLAPKPIPTHIPVQVIVVEQDAFATPQLVIEAPRPWVADLTVSRVDGGHWVIASQPQAIAELTRDFLQSRFRTAGRAEGAARRKTS